MELREIKTFKAVATFLNFNRAAEALNCVQSTVSAQIKALEEDFGVPLFDRLGKRVFLTEAGQVLLRYAGKMLALEDEILVQVTGKEEPFGLLSVRAPQTVGTYFLPEVIEVFNKQFPKISLDISSCAFHDLNRELKSGITDVAFLLTDMISSQELNSEVLGIEKLVIAAHPDHELAAHSVVRTEDLKKQTLLLPKHDCSYKMVFEQILSARKVRATVIEYNSIEAIKQCVLRGLGITLLPESALRSEIEQKRLLSLPYSEGPLETAILMIWHKDKWISPALKCFMDAARTLICKLAGGHSTLERKPVP
jgi:DNA-binding transcriptional LysR family regulator